MTDVSGLHEEVIWALEVAIATGATRVVTVQAVTASA
jgi:hypothetical protein